MGIPWNSLEFNESPLTSFGIQWKLFEIPRTSIGDPVKSFGTHRSPWKCLIEFLLTLFILTATLWNLLKTLWIQKNHGKLKKIF